MSNHQRRLKEIELALTPSEVVFLWMQKALVRNYEELLLDFDSPNPFVAIANSVDTIVKTSMKGESQTLVDRALLQAHKEAYFLLLLVMNVNHKVLNERFESNREYGFLLPYLESTRQCHILSSFSGNTIATMITFWRAVSSIYEQPVNPICEEIATLHSALSSILEEPLRIVTLAFVQRILHLEQTVSRISAEHFGRPPDLIR